VIRLGVIGHGGRISGVIRHPLRDVEPDVRVVGIVDPNEEAARSRLDECDRQDVVFYGSVDELVRQGNLDALMIGTRCNLHTPFAIEAARYDLPLYLEKPVANSMEQALALEAAFEDTRCQVVVSFPLRVSPLCEMAKSLLSGGAVGRPEHILGVNYVPYGHVYFDDFYRNYSVTQGLFLQKATHDLDYMVYLMGARITTLAAMGSFGRVYGGDKPAGLFCSACDEAESCLESPRNRKRHGSGTTADHPCVFGEDIGTPETGMNEDSSSALVEFADGTKGVYTQVFYTRRDAGTRGATISGQMGTVSFDWYTNKCRYVRHHQPFSDTLDGADVGGHAGGDHELCYDFVRLIKTGEPSRTPVATGIQSAYTCLAAKESMATNTFVKVRQVGECC
jgi:predicted dehydrogenase